MVETYRKNLSSLHMLLCYLKKYSYKEGTFTLASGKESDFYIDCKQTFLMPSGLLETTAQIVNFLARHFGVNIIAGEGVGGGPLAIAASLYSEIITSMTDSLWPVIVRNEKKDHGSGQRLEYSRDNIPEDKRVMLIEDVLTTGGSALRAVNVLKEEGFDVVGVSALVDRCEGASELFEKEGIKLLRVFTREDFVG